MIWATDSKGMNLIRMSNAVYDCGKSLEKVHAKIKQKQEKNL